MSQVYDIFSALKTKLETELTSANRVATGFVDERADDSDVTSFPSVIITLIDRQVDNLRRNGGFIRTKESETATQITYKKLPIPINYYFQLDVISNKVGTYLDILEVVEAMLGSRWANFTISGGRKLYMHLTDVNVLEGVEGLSTWRTAFRFYVQTWLEAPDSTFNKYKVLKLDINYGSTPLDTVEVVG